MTPATIKFELDVIETKCRALRAELARSEVGPKSISRALIEADASRLLKHAAKLYAEACRVSTQENAHP